MQKHSSDSIVYGTEIAEKMKNNVKKEVKSLTQELERKPKVVSIIVGDNKESKLYLKLRNKAFFEVGIDAIQYEFPNAVTERELLSKLKDINVDPSIDGIFVQLPLPNHIDTQRVLSFINPKKM